MTFPKFAFAATWSCLDAAPPSDAPSTVRTIVPHLAERRLTRESRGVLTSAQWQALLRTIWKE
jgi:hypothetical protein